MEKKINQNIRKSAKNMQWLKMLYIKKHAHTCASSLSECRDTGIHDLKLR